jgi:hypothetical protein
VTILASLAALGAILILVNNKLLSKKIKAVRLAKSEWEGWGKPLIKNGANINIQGKEFKQGYIQRVGDYWSESLGLPYTGLDTGIAWSAAFISWIFKKTGINDFKFSESHSTYIKEAVKERKNGNLKANFVAYKINEIAPQIGDLVCYSRENKTDLFDNQNNYRSHCDIVVSKSKNEIQVIGGNVNDAVTKKILKIDFKGELVDTNNKWFAVLKNNT